MGLIICIHAVISRAPHYPIPTKFGQWMFIHHAPSMHGIQKAEMQTNKQTTQQTNKQPNKQTHKQTNKQQKTKQKNIETKKKKTNKQNSF